jgi:hypothetical protein
LLAGFQSATTNLTSTFVLDAATPPVCYKSPEALCASAFKVTVMGNCKVVYKLVTPLFAANRANCLFGMESEGYVSGGKISPKDFGTVSPLLARPGLWLVSQ